MDKLARFINIMSAGLPIAAGIVFGAVVFIMTVELLHTYAGKWTAPTLIFFGAAALIGYFRVKEKEEAERFKELRNMFTTDKK